MNKTMRFRNKENEGGGTCRRNIDKDILLFYVN